MSEKFTKDGGVGETPAGNGSYQNTMAEKESDITAAPARDNNDNHHDDAGDTDNIPGTAITDPRPAAPAPPPNGGYGWVCAACVGIINAHTWGLNSSYGVFLAHYLANDIFPGATALEYAFVGSLSFSMALLVSPLATIGVRELGTKPTMLLGVVLEAASLVCASFATEMWQLFLTQGFLFGVGMGFLFVPSVAIVPQWFSTRRSLANGLSTSGSGMGGLIYSFASGAMIQNIGLAWTFRILGIIAFVVNVVCTLLIRDRNKIINATQLAFDMSLFKRPEYLLLMGYGWFSMLAYVVLVFSLANYANVIGLGASQAALISAFFNLGQVFGRPLIGYFSDRTGRISMASATTALAAVFALAIWIPATSYGVLIVFAILGGVVGGTFWVTVGPVTAEVVGLRHVASALNILWLTVVLPVTFSTPMAMQIVAGTGSYLGAQLFVGMTFLAAAACVVVLRGWKIGEVEEVARIAGAAEGPEGLWEMGRDKLENDEELIDEARRVGRKRMLLDCWKWMKV